MNTPLADLIRPDSLDDVVGQSHILAPGKPLRRIIDSGNIPNMIFFGPSGIGKTTVATIIANSTNKRLCKLNGTSASTSDIKDIISELDSFSTMDGVLLYLDEIQYFNKKQQQSLLEYMENGKITLIASTTENPYFYIYNALLSRSTIFEFKPVVPTEIIPAVRRAFMLYSKERKTEFCPSDKGVYETIAYGCGGDVRKAINAVELSCLATAPDENGKFTVTKETVAELSQKSSMTYDRDGDQHYNLLSAFQKSIRGSDENAALHYLARLLSAGDIISPCRRLLVIACEDIGLAYPQAITIVKACVDSAMQLGLPEARIPLAEAVVLLATAPKSNSAYEGINVAMEDVASGNCGDIPEHLQVGSYSGAKKLGKGQGYKYPHMYANNYVSQQYLPDNIKNKVYYKPGNNKTEQVAKEYWKKIK